MCKPPPRTAPCTVSCVKTLACLWVISKQELGKSSKREHRNQEDHGQEWRQGRANCAERKASCPWPWGYLCIKMKAGVGSSRPGALPVLKVTYLRDGSTRHSTHLTSCSFLPADTERRCRDMFFLVRSGKFSPAAPGYDLFHLCIDYRAKMH